MINTSVPWGVHCKMDWYFCPAPAPGSPRAPSHTATCGKCRSLIILWRKALTDAHYSKLATPPGTFHRPRVAPRGFETIWKTWFEKTKGEVDSKTRKPDRRKVRTSRASACDLRYGCMYIRILTCPIGNFLPRSEIIASFLLMNSLVFWAIEIVACSYLPSSESIVPCTP